jgi:hypothetical protein
MEYGTGQAGPESYLHSISICLIRPSQAPNFLVRGPGISCSRYYGGKEAAILPCFANSSRTRIGGF